MPHRGDTLLRMQTAQLIDEYGFARRDVPDDPKRLHVEGNALGGEHPFGAARRRALTQHEGSDSVRIAKPQNAVTNDHRHDRITAAAAAVDGIDGCEHVRRGHAGSAYALQLRGEHVQQNF